MRVSLSLFVISSNLLVSNVITPLVELMPIKEYAGKILKAYF